MHASGPAVHAMDMDVCVGAAQMPDDIAGREPQLQPHSFAVMCVCVSQFLWRREGRFSESPAHWFPVV